MANFTGGAGTTGWYDIKHTDFGYPDDVVTSNWDTSPNVPDAGSAISIAGVFTVTGGSGIYSGLYLGVGGTLTTNSEFSVSSITNGGAIGVQASGTIADFVLRGSAFTLTGGGTITLMSDVGNHYGAVLGNDANTNLTLTNADNTIDGAGQIGGFNAGALTLINNAIINATGPSDSGYGGLAIIADGGITNNALIEATSNELYTSSNIDNRDGQIKALDGAFIVLAGMVTGGTMSAIGSGVINADGATFDGTNTGGISLSGTVNTNSVTLKGVIANTGAVGVASLGNVNYLFIDQAGATLSGGGTIELRSDDPGRHPAVLTSGSGGNATLTNIDNTILGGGLISDNGNNLLTLINQGTISATGDSSNNYGALTIGASGGGLTNAGTIEAAAEGTTLNIATGTTVSNSGVLLASNGGILNVYDAVTGSGTALITDGGAISFAASFNEAVTFQAANAGTLGLSQAYAGVISGFTPGDTLDLTSLAYNSAYEAVYYAGANGGTLQIVDTANADMVAATLNFSGSLAGEEITLGGDGTGLDVFLTAAPAIMPAAGDVIVSGLSGQAYSAFEQFYSSGVFAGTDYFYTNVTGPAYSSYQYDYSAGNDFTGSKFFYTGVTGQAYSGYEYDYDGGGHVTRIDFTGVTGAPYSSYEYDFVGGLLAATKFEVTSVPNGATYSSYEIDYSSGNTFSGEKIFFTNISGQSYSGEEEDFDAAFNLSRVLLTGFSGQSYSALEEDFSGGTYSGYKAFYTGITGQSFNGEEVDVSAAGQLTKVIYSGMASTPYSSVETDYSGGALTGEVYNFTNVPGASAYAYHLAETPQGVVTQSIYDNNDGSHTILGSADDQTFTSIANDTFIGGGSGETFVFAPVYGHDTINDFASHLTGAGHDMISLATSEFANFAAVLSGAQNSGGNVVISAQNGDTLTLAGVNTTTLASLSTDFTFHA